MSTRSSSSDPRTPALLFAAIVLLVMVAVNLPYRYAERDGRLSRPTIIAPAFIAPFSLTTQTNAGWPCSYYTQLETKGIQQGSIDSYWSPLQLAANVLITLLASASVYLFTRLRQRRVRSSSNQVRTRLVFDSITGGVIIAIPLVFFAFAALTAREHRTLARQAGICYLSSMFPEPIVDRVPSAIANLFTRIRLVDVTRPNDALIKKIMAIKTLRAFNVVGQTYDQSHLAALSNHHQLLSLGIHRNDLSIETARSIGSIDQLSQLDLSQSNLAARHLKELSQLKMIQWLRFVQTPLKLQEIQDDFAWAKSVRILMLSRPELGVKDSLHIDGWDRLEQVHMQRRELQTHGTEFDLIVRNCPNLNRLQLDRFQKFSIELKNLPRLIQVGDAINGTAMFRGLGADVPGCSWFSKLHLENLPNLEFIDCLIDDLTSIRLTKMEQLQELRLGAFEIKQGGTTIGHEVPTEKCQQIIDQLGQCEGPRSINMEFIPLSDVDLSKLAMNDSIHQLQFSITGLQFDQFQQLASMHQLESIRLGECPLKTDDLEWLIQTFPNLKYVQANLFHARELNLASIKNLQDLQITAVNQPRSIKLIDLPQLSGSITLLNSPQDLEITNATSLRGLAIGGPWPANHQLDGLRKLDWFAAGGKELDDDIFDQLIDCNALDQLTLAYSSVSKDRLNQIARFRKLSVLRTPGSDVDDSVTEHWHDISHLQYLNLDDTAVSEGTIRWAGTLSNLTSLSVNRVPLNRSSARLVPDLQGIRELHVADTGLPASSIEPILQSNGIRFLDLSGMALTNALLDAAEQCKTLENLRIDRCSFLPERLLQLLQQRDDIDIQINRDHPLLVGSLQEAVEEANAKRRKEEEIELSEISFSSNTSLGNLTGSSRHDIEASQIALKRPGKIDLDKLRAQLKTEDQL